jgi:hypothetical protein
VQKHTSRIDRAAKREDLLLAFGPCSAIPCFIPGLVSMGQKPVATGRSNQAVHLTPSNGGQFLSA